MSTTSPVDAVDTFLEDLRASSLAGTDELLPSGIAGGWPDAFRALTTTLPDSPSIVVIDELPWLAEQDELFDGALQTAWDRLLSRRPVLLLLLGSDIHMMERLTAYDRPFFGRADNMVLGPLNPAEVGGADLVWDPPTSSRPGRHGYRDRRRGRTTTTDRLGSVVRTANACA